MQRRCIHSLSGPGSRTPVTKFAALRLYRFFAGSRKRMLRVRSPSLSLAQGGFRLKAVLSFTATLIITSSIFADTPGQLRAKAAPACYCRCTRGASRGGCVKMCELPKFATRWWAKSCGRPRQLAPREDHDAGPRLHHRVHAERASR
jgi:hypothetical protein